MIEVLPILEGIVDALLEAAAHGGLTLCPYVRVKLGVSDPVCFGWQLRTETTLLPELEAAIGTSKEKS